MCGAGLGTKTKSIVSLGGGVQSMRDDIVAFISYIQLKARARVKECATR
jgi:hypothetical protein